MTVISVCYFIFIFFSYSFSSLSFFYSILCTYIYKKIYIFILCLILLFLLFYSVALFGCCCLFSNFNVLGTLELLKSNNNNKIKNYCNVFIFIFIFLSFFFCFHFISFFILFSSCTLEEILFIHHRLILLFFLSFLWNEWLHNNVYMQASYNKHRWDVFFLHFFLHFWSTESTEQK